MKIFWKRQRLKITKREYKVILNTLRKSLGAYGEHRNYQIINELIIKLDWLQQCVDPAKSSDLLEMWLQAKEQLREAVIAQQEIEKFRQLHPERICPECNVYQGHIVTCSSSILKDHIETGK